MSGIVMKRHNSPTHGLMPCRATNAGPRSGCDFSNGGDNSNCAHLMLNDVDAKKYKELEEATLSGGALGGGISQEDDELRQKLFVQGVRAYNQEFGDDDTLSDEEITDAMYHRDASIEKARDKTHKDNMFLDSRFMNRALALENAPRRAAQIPIGVQPRSASKKAITKRENHLVTFGGHGIVAKEVEYSTHDKMLLHDYEMAYKGLVQLSRQFPGSSMNTPLAQRKIQPDLARLQAAADKLPKTITGDLSDPLTASHQELHYAFDQVENFKNDMELNVEFGTSEALADNYINGKIVTTDVTPMDHLVLRSADDKVQVGISKISQADNLKDLNQAYADCNKTVDSIDGATKALIQTDGAAYEFFDTKELQIDQEYYSKLNEMREKIANPGGLKARVLKKKTMRELKEIDSILANLMSK